jgi:hypothetical protein
MCEVLYVVDRSFREDAVPEIENVPGASVSALQDIFRARSQFIPLRKQ